MALLAFKHAHSVLCMFTAILWPNFNQNDRANFLKDDPKMASRINCLPRHTYMAEYGVGLVGK